VSALIKTDGEVFCLADTPVAAIALHDCVALVDVSGSVRFTSGVESKISTAAVSATSDYSGFDLLIGDEKGVVHFMGRNGHSAALNAPLNKWVEHVAGFDSGNYAAACGKQIILFDVDTDAEIHRWTHESAVTGLAVDPKGKRLAVSHYNGVSLWWANNPTGARTLLEWKGSHTGVSWSPDGKFIVTAMQELALHGWRIADKTNMRMAGYPSKTRTMCWTFKGKYLATSGAAPVVCWPFATKDGPMGKGPLEMSPHGNTLCTAVACDSYDEVISAGYDDGTVLLHSMKSKESIVVVGGNGSSVAALAFSLNGNHLAFARDDGSAGYINL
jgi:WD40 repeat protein